MPKKRTNDSWMKKKCDPLWSLLIREGADYTCALCGNQGKWVHAHHLISKGRRFFRHNLNNGICLCAQCHTFNSSLSAHGAPWAFEAWMEKNRPEQFSWWAKNRYQEFPGLKIDFEQVHSVLAEQREGGDA